jgi:hypothetical protein
MAVQLWVSYWLGVGTPLFLILEDREAQKGVSPFELAPDIEGRATQPFQDAANQAYCQTVHTLGWPAHKSFVMSLKQIDDAYPLPRRLDGDSLFGGVAIGLAQAVARAEPDCLRYPARQLLALFQGVCLTHVAVTAGCHPRTKGFAPVGCIRDKLDCFCQLDLTGRPAVCVVAAAQSLNGEDARCRKSAGEPDQPDGEPAVYTPHNGAGPLPLLAAYDAIDAYLKLFERQSRFAARAFLT